MVVVVVDKIRDKIRFSYLVVVVVGGVGGDKINR
jgi:hypothetical protein